MAMQDCKPGKVGRKNGGFTLLELAVTLAVIVIVSSGVFLALRQPDRRAIDNAALQLQADIRYAQRLALMSGREHDVVFERAHNRYRIRELNPTREIRSVYFQNGVRLRYTNRNYISFQARGTASGSFTLTLESGRYSRQLTSTVSGGRIELRNTVY